jgi:2-keto-4-pentenoate hydratase
VRDLLKPDGIDAAYQVQAVNLAAAYAAGQSLVGRKIGLTSEAVQRQLGVDQPDFGVLLDGMAIGSGDTVPAGRLLQPKVEAEVAFWLGDDLNGPLASVEEIRPALATACAAIEIVDSRVAGWDISIADTIADNASSGLFVTSARRMPLSEVEPTEVAMRLEVNGELASAGTGVACLGDPLNAVLWLARTAQRLGTPLRAGEVVLSGALGPMTTVRPGDNVSATITGLGSVEITFGKEH